MKSLKTLSIIVFTFTVLILSTSKEECSSNCESDVCEHVLKESNFETSQLNDARADENRSIKSASEFNILSSIDIFRLILN